MQEGLTNITKHAAATHVRLYLERDAEAVRGLLQDDGVGFASDQVMHPEAPRGLGLLGIQERLGALGGTLNIISAPGQGTTLQITIPIEPREVSVDADEARDETPFQAAPTPEKPGWGMRHKRLSAPWSHESPLTQ
jgi:signal transduction histidine kinase